MNQFITHEINSIQKFMSDDMGAPYGVTLNVIRRISSIPRCCLKEFILIRLSMFHTKPEDLTDSERQEITVRCGKKCGDLLRAAIYPPLFNAVEQDGGA